MDKDVRLHGVHHFGREGCEYTVSMEIKHTATNLSMVKSLVYIPVKKTWIISIMALMFFLALL